MEVKDRIKQAKNDIAILRFLESTGTVVKHAVDIDEQADKIDPDNQARVRIIESVADLGVELEVLMYAIADLVRNNDIALSKDVRDDLYNSLEQ